MMDDIVFNQNSRLFLPLDNVSVKFSAGWNDSWLEENIRN